MKVQAMLPLSAQKKINISRDTVVKASTCAWYCGTTLLEMLDALKKVKRLTGESLHFPVLQAIGKVEAGGRTSKVAQVMLTEAIDKVTALWVDDVAVKAAGVGKNVLITLEATGGDKLLEAVWNGCTESWARSTRGSCARAARWCRRCRCTSYGDRRWMRRSCWGRA